MNLVLHRSDYFNQDFDIQYRWYLEQAGFVVADKFLDSVLATIRLLAAHPDLGCKQHFRNPKLLNMRSFRVASPFGVHLIFYRRTASELYVERLMHGARDLPSRLAEPPGS